MVGLLDPLEIKGFTLKNRIVMPPMQTHLSTTEGAVTNRLIEHYVKRSKALGPLIVEHDYVSLECNHNSRQLGIYDDDVIPGLQKPSQSVHSTGTPLVIQIDLGGWELSQASNMEIAGIQPFAPSLGGSTLARALLNMND